MIVTRIDDKNYLVKIPFDNNSSYYLDEQEEILSFFKIIFGRLISKYKISGDVNIDFYLDYDYGIILEICNKCSYGDDILTKIIFHIDCKFLVEVDYFQYLGKGIWLYYFKNKFYKEICQSDFIDGEIVYDSDKIMDECIRIYA